MIQNNLLYKDVLIFHNDYFLLKIKLGENDEATLFTARKRKRDVYPFRLPKAFPIEQLLKIINSPLPVSQPIPNYHETHNHTYQNDILK